MDIAFPSGAVTTQTGVALTLPDPMELTFGSAGGAQADVSVTLPDVLGLDLDLGGSLGALTGVQVTLPEPLELSLDVQGVAPTVPPPTSISLDRLVAGFRWDEGGEVEEHLLPFRLLDVTPLLRRPSWSLEVLSGQIHTEKGVIRAHEITGVIRFERRAQELLELLSDREGLPITYWEQRPGESELTFPSILVAVETGGAWTVGLQEDPQRSSFGEYAVRIRLRRVDGGNYRELL